MENKVNKFTFKTDLTLEDYKGLCWMLSAKTVAVIAVAGGIFLYLMLMRILNQPVLLALAAIAGAVVIYIGMYFYVSKRANKIYRLSNVSSQLVLTMDEKGIVQNSDSGEFELLWEDVQRVAENKNCYFVFMSKHKAFYFPKRNFASNDDEKTFIEYIVEYVSPMKIKFKR